MFFPCFLRAAVQRLFLGSRADGLPGPSDDRVHLIHIPLQFPYRNESHASFIIIMEQLGYSMEFRRQEIDRRTAPSTPHEKPGST